MSERSERDQRLAFQALAAAVGLISGPFLGIPVLLNLVLTITSSLVAWGVAYVLSDGEINLLTDLRDWWNDLRNPPRYPFA